MSHQPTVDKAQGGMRLKADGEMGVEVHGVIATHAQDAAVLGCSRFPSPGRGRAIAGPGAQRGAGGQASFQQLATA